MAVNRPAGRALTACVIGIGLALLPCLAMAQTLEELLERAERTTGRDPAARTADDLYSLGAVAAQRGEYVKAEQLLQQSAVAARGAGYKDLEANALVELMAVRLVQGKTAEAAELSEAVDKLAGALALAPVQVRVGTVQGWLAEACANRAEALRRYVAAEQALEQVRAGPATEALHIGLLESRGGIHARLVNLLGRIAEQGQKVEEKLLGTRDASLAALHYAEAGRGRALLGRMHGVFVTEPTGLGKRDAAKLKGLQEQVDEARKALSAEMAKQEPERKKLDELAGKLREAHAAHDAFRDRLLVRTPAQALRAGREEAIGPGDAGQVCADARCVALEYWVGDEESWAWVVSPWPRPVRLWRIGSGRQELGELVGRLQRALTREPPAQELAQAALAQLAKVLLPDGLPGMPPDGRLVILPDGPLSDLPFGLLPYQGKLLLEHAPLAYVPSLSLLRALGKAGWPGAGEATIAVLARPKSPDSRAVDLPGTEQEAKAIAEIAGDKATVLMGARATEGAAKDAARKSDVLHLAVHGLLDRQQPAHSALLLTPAGDDDGLLEATELASLPMASKLVVLSACRSASGGYVAGEGLIGLTRALFAGGAKGVIASQWQVPDEQVAELMKRFYTQLMAHGDPARALQAAQLQVAADVPAMAWAPFLYVGAG